jgi:hypothetical protein
MLNGVGFASYVVHAKEGPALPTRAAPDFALPLSTMFTAMKCSHHKQESGSLGKAGIA